MIDFSRNKVKIILLKLLIIKLKYGNIIVG